MQGKNDNSNSVVERLRRYRTSQGTTWDFVAAKLGVSRGMLMMVLRQDRRLSTKALFRLEQAEREVVDRRSAAERIVEALIGQDDVISQIVGREKSVSKTVDVPIQYEKATSSKSLPAKVSLCSPVDEDRRKLRSLFAETLDTRIIALACLPKEFRAEQFLDQLTPESRTRLTNSALGLVIPDWRTLVTAGM